ncbi:hypothetical protein BJ912DRAFT_262132 [Pholiota molesta]|nr:hypothetical protein BJ912DRAFT_262132 [Pholiota molesta]
MCYSAGSITQAVSPCPMCMVYPHPKCPHIRETCRNRGVHPRMDVLYLTNAEVERFNGCGFCKVRPPVLHPRPRALTAPRPQWASLDPPAKAKGYANPGWPGCCRPPSPSEYHMIQIAEWKAVSIVHHIPIPPDVERVLAAIHLPPTRPPSTQSTSPMNRSPTSKSTMPPTSRKSSSASTPSKSASKPINTRLRTGAAASTRRRARPARISPAPRARTPSPRPCPAPPPWTRSRAAKHPARPIAGPRAHTRQIRRRVANPWIWRTRIVHLPRPALERSTAATDTRHHVCSVSKVVAADSRARDVSLKRRSLISDVAATTSSPVETPRKEASFLIPRSPREELSSSASSSSGSSDGLGSITDSTVTSDGGFTDYLSDESEAELQRQAEARAVVLAQNQAEELEFKLARQQLASVGLKPPKSWNPNATPPRSPAGRARRGMGDRVADGVVCGRGYCDSPERTGCARLGRARLYDERWEERGEEEGRRGMLSLSPIPYEWSGTFLFLSFAFFSLGFLLLSCCAVG